MPDIDFAFLADAAQARPGEKFSVLGGGVSRLAARTFPFRHPHLALVIGLSVTAPETNREHEVRFVLLDPDGRELAGAGGVVRASPPPDARDSVLTFAVDLGTSASSGPAITRSGSSSTARSGSGSRSSSSGSRPSRTRPSTDRATPPVTPGRRPVTPLDPCHP